MVLERKKVNSLSEYIDFIRSWFGNNWTLNNVPHLKTIHGIPNSYPAIVWIEEVYDNEALWGDGYSNEVHIIDKQNLIIERRRGQAN